MESAMDSPCKGGRTLGQFALVSYLSDPLASFLDRLRLDLDPECSPHAHVTILPPRPMSCEIREALDELIDESRLFPPFDVELGDIRLFPVSNVIYIEIARGERELRKLHGLLEKGRLRYKCRFDFHPHITIGQDLNPELNQQAFEIARDKWNGWDGPKSFTVENLSFVQNVAPLVWVDIQRVPLAVPVPAGK
jgi:2'-5' RNA ligase